VRGFELSFAGLDIRFSCSQIAFRLIKIGARCPSLLKKCLLPLEMIADLVLLCFRRSEVGLCDAKGVKLIQGFQPAQ
jgi:hypothetical protein